MKKQIALIAGILIVSVAFRLMRASLVGVQSPSLAAWPSHVIFGLYFAILALAIQALQRLFESIGHHYWQALLLLILIGICLDLVLVNVQEITTQVDASYGPVVIWDLMTFFIWMHVVDLCRPDGDGKFWVSWTVRVAPLFGVGREILFLPYRSHDVGLAYLDLLFGHGLVSFWILVALLRRTKQSTNAVPVRGERALIFIISTGCAYWLVSGLGNIFGLAWAPFYPSLYRVLERFGLPIPILNCFQFMIATGITLIIYYSNFLGIGTRLGLGRRSTFCKS